MKIGAVDPSQLLIESASARIDEARAHPSQLGSARGTPPSLTVGASPKGASPLAGAAPGNGGAPAHDPAKVKLAREFEQIFLRKMLAPLEKAGASKGAAGGSGKEVYGSMVVGAMADAMTQAGGLGLADMMLETIEGRHGFSVGEGRGSTGSLPKPNEAEGHARSGKNHGAEIVEPANAATLPSHPPDGQPSVSEGATIPAMIPKVSGQGTAVDNSLKEPHNRPFTQR